MSNIRWRCATCKVERCTCGRHTMEPYCLECEGLAVPKPEPVDEGSGDNV